ncbi:MAG: serine hydrolase [Lachnospiraceae bacterium]|nr:serine hydrolase [Lachnospiraceae bacterium]
MKRQGSHKPIRKLISIIAVIMAAVMLPVYVAAETSAPPRPLGDLTGSGILPPTGFDISARSAYLIELGSGEVLYAKNANEDRYPASITKIMTAMVVLEHCSLDEQVTFSHASVTDLEDGGHDARFKEGEVLTVEQCLYGLMLDSVNSCGYALAEHVAGSLADFAALMNEKARSIGCTNTNFTNPHGLNDEKHRTTAHDMALIMWNALQNPDFYRIDSARTYRVEATEKRPEGYTFTMHHKMMQPESEFYYDTVVAGKTGYTSLAFNTLVTYAKRDGAELIAVVMKESQGSGTIYRDTKKLLDYGFDKFTLTDISSLAGGFDLGLRSIAPMPVTTDSSLKLYLPTETTNISFNFSSSDTMGLEKAIGSLQIKAGEAAVAGRAIVADEALMSIVGAGENPQGGTDTQNPDVQNPDAQNPDVQNPDVQNPDAQNPDEQDTGSTQEKGGSGFVTFLKVIMWIIIIGVLGIGGWWCAVQLIKRRRREEAARKAARKVRMDRIKSLRGDDAGARNDRRDPLDL